MSARSHSKARARRKRRTRRYTRRDERPPSTNLNAVARRLARDGLISWAAAEGTGEPHQNPTKKEGTSP